MFTKVRSNGCSRVRWRDFERSMGMNIGSDESSRVIEGMGRNATIECSSVIIWWVHDVVIMFASLCI